MTYNFNNFYQSTAFILEKDISKAAMVVSEETTVLIHITLVILDCKSHLRRLCPVGVYEIIYKPNFLKKMCKINPGEAVKNLLAYSKPEVYSEALTEMWESWLTNERNDFSSASDRADKLTLYNNLNSFLRSLGA